MSYQALCDFTEPLPYGLRQQIQGYAASIEAASEDIFRKEGVDYDAELHDRLVFLAGVRRLWTIVDTQYWILNNSLDLMGQNGVNGFAIGHRNLDRNSDEFVALETLRQELTNTLNRLNLQAFVSTPTISSLLLMIREERNGRH